MPDPRRDIYDCPVCGAGREWIDYVGTTPHSNSHDLDEYLCRACQHALTLLVLH